MLNTAEAQAAIDQMSTTAKAFSNHADLASKALEKIGGVEPPPPLPANDGPDVRGWARPMLLRDMIPEQLEVFNNSNSIVNMLPKEVGIKFGTGKANAKHNTPRIQEFINSVGTSRTILWPAGTIAIDHLTDGKRAHQHMAKATRLYCYNTTGKPAIHLQIEDQGAYGFWHRCGNDRLKSKGGGAVLISRPDLADGKGTGTIRNVTVGGMDVVGSPKGGYGIKILMGEEVEVTHSTLHGINGNAVHLENVRSNGGSISCGLGYITVRRTKEGHAYYLKRTNGAVFQAIQALTHMSHQAGIMLDDGDGNIVVGWDCEGNQKGFADAWGIVVKNQEHTQLFGGTTWHWPRKVLITGSKNTHSHGYRQNDNKAVKAHTVVDKGCENTHVYGNTVTQNDGKGTYINNKKVS